MKTNDEDNKNSKSNFLKTNFKLLVLFFLAVCIIIFFTCNIFSTRLNHKSIENDVSTTKTTSLISAQKVICYSSAYGENNEESDGRWDLDLSQYTDMAIYLDVQDNISSMYIDNISFSNSDFGNLSLCYLPSEDFAKSPFTNNKSDTNDKDSNLNTNNISNNVQSNISNMPQVQDRIDLPLSTPITLRYLNYHLKENCLIMDIDNPLTFDGSILKRGKVTISSLKNTVSFTLHLINNSGKEFTYPMSIPINLENDAGENIYSGSILEETYFSH